MSLRTPDGRLVIDGALVAAEAGGRLQVEDPSTAGTAGEVDLGSAADVDRAITAARREADQGSWPRLAPAERAEVLVRLADLVTDHTEAFTDLVVREVGSPTTIARLGQVVRPLDHYRDMVTRGAAGLDRDLQTLDGPPSTRQVIARPPRGVVAAITPWNAPHLLNLWKVAPALVTGNTMVLKPSELAPSCGLLLGELALEAGVPAGVLNVVTGRGEVGAALVDDPRVDMITFTGSTPTGRAIARQAAGRFAHVLLELGGKSALLALEDADVTSLVPAVMRFVTMAGQGCGLLTRILVPDAIHDQVVAALVAAFQHVAVGPADRAGVVMGPVITADARSRVEAAIDRAVADGATVAAGGARPDVGAAGYFLEPTLLIDVDNRSAAAQEEIFGPVISVIRHSGDPDEGIALANDSAYGLMGAVWTADVDRGSQIARRIRAGQVRVNAVASTTEGPFGGMKASGVGRECGDLGLLEYTEVQYLAWPAR